MFISHVFYYNNCREYILKSNVGQLSKTSFSPKPFQRPLAFPAKSSLSSRQKSVKSPRSTRVIDRTMLSACEVSEKILPRRDWRFFKQEFIEILYIKIWNLTVPH